MAQSSGDIRRSADRSEGVRRVVTGHGPDDRPIFTADEQV